MSLKGQWLKYTDGAMKVVGCSSYSSHFWDKEPDKKQCKKGKVWAGLQFEEIGKGMAAAGGCWPHCINNQEAACEGNGARLGNLKAHPQ